MATDDISVSIGVQGESKFKKALAECQNTVKQLDSALKANAAEYEANADALGENVERTKLLRKSIELQKKMAEGLGDAIEHATKEYGAASRQTTQYVVAQNKAKEAVAKLKKELKESDRELEELGRDSVRVGRQLEQGLGDSARDAARDLSDMMDEVQGALESIGRSTGITATIDIAQNVMEGIRGITEETEDYRRYMSYLEQSAKDYGQNWGEVEAHAIHVAALTGELEGAAEGISNLMAAGLNSKETADAVNLLMGAVIKFPDTYKFESLAEALRNTIEEGKAVGQFSELLLALGVDIETFDKAMEKASTKDRRQDIALSFGANRGLENTANEYMLANEEMLKANEAVLTYKGNLADLAEQLQPVATAWTELASAAVGTVSTILGDSQLDEWITARIKDITEIIKMLATPEGREELIQEALGEDFGKTIGEVDNATEIENLKRAIKEVKMTGDSVMLFSLETRLKELEAAQEAGKETGEGAIDSMKTAIEDATPDLVKATAAAVDAVNAEFDRVAVPDVAGEWESQMNRLQAAPMPRGWNLGGGIAPEATNPMLVSLNIDGRKFASATVDYYNEAQGRQINMNV